MHGVIEAIDRRHLKGCAIDTVSGGRPVELKVLWKETVVASTLSPPPDQAPTPRHRAGFHPFEIALPMIADLTPRAAAACLRVQARPVAGGTAQVLPVSRVLAKKLGWCLPGNMPPGRIAYLFLCATAPLILGRALRVLRHAGDAFFVHVDRKVPQAPFQAEAEGSGAQFLTDRVDVKWGTFSMIEAEFALLHAALAAGPFDHFVLLSDDSFPIRPIAAIRAGILGREVGVQANLVPATDRNKMDRYEGFHAFGSRSAQGWHRGFAPADAPSLRELADFMETCGKKPVPLRHGTQWVVLGMDEVERILAGHADMHLRRSFIHSRIPDEHYFQTILGMQEGFAARPPAMYTDWSVLNGPRRFAQVQETIDALWSAGLFMRKLVPDAVEVADFLAGECAPLPEPSPNLVLHEVEDAGPLFVMAEHAHWRAELRLDPRNRRVLHRQHGSRGSYRLSDERLEVFWDHHPPELFLRQGDVYRLARWKEAQPA